MHRPGAIASGQAGRLGFQTVTTAMKDSSPLKSSAVRVYGVTRQRTTYLGRLTKGHDEGARA